MDDHLQLAEAKPACDHPPPPITEMSIAYDAGSESCSFRLPCSERVHPESDTESSLEKRSEEHTAILLREGEKKSKFQIICPMCYNFFQSYRSANPQERVTPFAVVLLLVLLVVYVWNQADRLVLPVVIPAGLRCELSSTDDCGTINTTLPNVTNDTNLTTGNDNGDCISFSDAEQGLITGPAFTVIYVLAGLPLARLADTRSRPLVLLLGMTFWSIMVLLTGFTQTFWQLLLLRLFLGIGEASCNPVAYSLIADFYPPQHRAFALSVYHYGVYLGGGLGWILPGVVATNSSLNWRWPFWILGGVGLVMVPIALVALWEPKKIREKRKMRQKGKSTYTIKEVILYLIKNPPFLMLLIAASVRNIPGYALGAWLPTFYSRKTDVTEYGFRVGLMVLFGGGVGSFLGGFLSDRLSTRWKNAKAFVIAASQLLAAPCIAAVLLVPNLEASYWLLFVAYVTAETWLGPAAAIVQDVCMPAMRAQASAVYIGVITIVASVGPVIVPGLFDHVKGFDECDHGVGYSLLLTVPTLYVASAVLFSFLGVVIHWWNKRHPPSYDRFNNEREQRSVSPSH